MSKELADAHKEIAGLKAKELIKVRKGLYSG